VSQQDENWSDVNLLIRNEIYVTFVRCQIKASISPKSTRRTGAVIKRPRRKAGRKTERWWKRKAQFGDLDISLLQISSRFEF
jgi:hypothetical protein